MLVFQKYLSLETQSSHFLGLITGTTGVLANIWLVYMAHRFQIEKLLFLMLMFHLFLQQHNF